ncbi:MAG: hypothetical protein JXA69_08305 [Phycisphaerae bacterium]|nr:hypothetical protein [Phycisphaerae bacterium]
MRPPKQWREPTNQACLPVVRRGGIEYVYDARLGQLRRLDEPRKVIEVE